MVILSIPVSMGIKPQIHEIEIFVSVEDLKVPTSPLKTQKETKKPHPQPEPVKENVKPIEASPLQIKKPEIIEPVREVSVEPVKEVNRQPAEEVKVEQIEIELNSPPTTEGKEPLFIPPMPTITEGSTDIPAKNRSIEASIRGVEQPRRSQDGIGGEASSLIETRFGASVAPTFLHREIPVYPMMARKLGREGKVLLKLTIDENGNLLDVEVMEKAGYGFTEAAIEAVKKSTFLPAKKDGKPIASRALLPIKFRLERN